MTTDASPRAKSIAREPRAQLAERVAERVIKLVALGSVAAVVAILVVVWKEALPLFTSSEVHAEVTPGALFSTTDGWDPQSERYAIVPLLVGSLKVTAIAVAIGAPLALGSALFVAEYASRRARGIIKPTLELLASVPSVLVGLVALTLVAPLAARALGATHPLNALVAGVGLAFAICPIVFSIAEDALRAVPESYRTAAIAMGSTRAQMLLRIVIPAAGPGLGGAVLLGLGRALGGTMIVTMASGNVASMGGLDARTIPATLALEVANPHGSAHRHVLFALGTILFFVTFVINLLGERVVLRMRERLPPEVR